MSRPTAVLAALGTGTAVLALLGLLLGPVRVPVPEALRVLTGAAADPRWRVVVGTLRAPRVLTAAAAGAGLGVAGLQMQTLFPSASAMTT